MPWPASRRLLFIRTLEEARALASFVALLGAQPETLAMGSELLVNGVEHGNLGIDFAEKSRLRESDCWEDEMAVAWPWTKTAASPCACGCGG
jgi:hypothetical protein